MSVYEHDRGVAREDLCRFLAACYCEPAREFAEEKLFDAMTHAASYVSADAAQRAQGLAQSFADEGPQSLLVDYARLFLGPPQPLAAPYGSVWLDEERKVMGESTFAASALYAELGFELDEQCLEAPDHIAIELECLYLAILRENEARRSGDAEALQAASKLKRRLLDEHLGRWVEPFASAVDANARSPFYRELARLTTAFIQTEKKEGSPA